MTKTQHRNPADLPIPDAHFRCEGVSFGAEAIAEIHFHDPDGGFFSPSDLYYATLFEKSSNTECSGFFCTSCLQAFNRTYASKKSLQDAITTKVEQAQQNAVKELTTIFRPRAPHKHRVPPPQQPAAAALSP